jgi:hypothetical protein
VCQGAYLCFIGYLMDINVGVKVKVKQDTKVWEKMVRNLSKHQGTAVEVGFWGDIHKSGVSVAQVASWNEEGHVNGGKFAGTITPPRPFIRVGFMRLLRNPIWMNKYYKDIHNIAIGNLTWKNLHERMAEELKDKMKLAILEWKTPPNSATTIALKGFNDPLIDSGQMYDSVKARIGRKVRR